MATSIPAVVAAAFSAAAVISPSSRHRWQQEEDTTSSKREEIPRLLMPTIKQEDHQIGKRDGKVSAISYAKVKTKTELQGRELTSQN